MKRTLITFLILIATAAAREPKRQVATITIAATPDVVKASIMQHVAQIGQWTVDSESAQQLIESRAMSTAETYKWMSDYWIVGRDNGTYRWVGYVNLIPTGDGQTQVTDRIEVQCQNSFGALYRNVIDHPKDMKRIDAALSDLKARVEAGKIVAAQ